MPGRQSFGDFLNSSEPATPRGTGRGRGRVGRGGANNGAFGGGRGVGRGGGRGGHLTSDYSNVSLDYNTVNTKSYASLERFSVQPFGSSGSPSRRGPSNGNVSRGRGNLPRGTSRGTFRLATPRTPQTPSRSATPITGGLGYHVTRVKGTTNNRGSMTPSTLGAKGKVTWGGGMAPLFVKAGELFKEGEVDVIKQDGDKLSIEVYPLSDPSAPQMVDLNDEREVEILTGGESLGLSDDFEPQNAAELLAIISRRSSAHSTSSPSKSFVIDLDLEEEFIQTPMNLPMESSEKVTGVQYSNTLLVRSESAEVADSSIDHPCDPASKLIDEEESTDFFTIDTTPAEGIPDEIRLSYDVVNTEPLGTSVLNNTNPAASDDEDIVFRPRLFTDPVPSTLKSTSPEITGFELPRSVYVDPRVTMNRKGKKAAKREKRARNKRNKGKSSTAKTMPRDDSDLDWGSDSEPKGLNSPDDNDQVAILRNFFAGTGLDPADIEHEVDPEIDFEAMKRFGEGITRIGHETDTIMELLDGREVEWESSDDNLEFDTKDRDKGKLKEMMNSDEDASGTESEDDDFAALAAAYDSENDDDDDDHDDENRPSTSNWSNNSAWFNEKLDTAGTGATSRLFQAIYNGDLVNALPTEPIKRDKKGKHIPTELYDQWERDRQKKAEKKRQREVERMLAALDPFPASRKGKGKFSGKIAAASMAHLIPASAAEVADLFDIDSEDDGWNSSQRKGSRAALLPQTLDQLNIQIREFLADPGKNTMTLPAMDKEGRKKVHLLAECFHLKSKSRGKGNSRFPVIIKLARSGLNVDEDKIERLLSAATFTGGAFYKALHTKSKKPKAQGGSAARATGPSTRAREGELVGEGADRIGQDNVGHRLLSRMGWTEGDTIGRTGGLDAPIVAVVKYTKSGLGA